MTKRKTRKEKEFEYIENYGNIPIDFVDRLAYMYDKYNITEKKELEILNTRDQMIDRLYYKNIRLVLFEDPEGKTRSRYRLINRSNFVNAALTNNIYVHVYDLDARSENNRMKRIVNEELASLNQLISTPINIVYSTYFKTPEYYNTTLKFLAELGLERPITKPDWDNIGKKYCDMSNETIWLDDSFVIEGTVKKFYSILPRIEIDISYLSKLYNKHQYNSVTNRKDFKENQCVVDYFQYNGGSNYGE